MMPVVIPAEMPVVIPAEMPAVIPAYAAPYIACRQSSCLLYQSRSSTTV